MISSKELEKKRKSYKSILGIVKAMKALSAANIRKGGAALNHTRRYRELVDGAASAALSLPGVSLLPHGGRKLLVAFGSQYGLCGAFNERVLKETEDSVAALPEVVGLVYVGKRLSDRAPDLPGLSAWKLDAPGSIEGIGDAMNALLSLVYEKYKSGEFDELYFISPEFTDESLSVMKRKVLPPDFRPGVSLDDVPLVYIDPRELMEGLIEEHLYIYLYSTALEAIIAENETRMRSMDFAAKNIKKRVDDLTQSFNYAFQEEVTGELLEIISGYEALRKSKNKGP
ncbi:MAG: FoF1 ATP synthase subunit gamma [Nitrospirota bacterium]